MKIQIILLLSFFTTHIFAQNISIDIHPGHTRAIQGHSELNRLKYFNLCDKGSWFEGKASDKGGASYFLDDRNVSFGRDLGLVYSEKNWGNSLQEDPSRPGYTDTTFMINSLSPDDLGASSDFKLRFEPNLDIVNHDRRDAFPEWMEKYQTAQSGNEWIPTNIEAASEITSTLLKYRYTDFHRPAYFELVNEPHWSFWGDQHFADWHADLAQTVRSKQINTLIGGPCLSVAYFYRNNYQYLYNFTQFIDNTNFELDFYSFHIYDYLQWNETEQEFTGAVSTGLPSFGVFDAIANYTRINYGQPAKLVISEHGGYISQGDEAAIVENIGSQYFPGTGFEYELEKRSIINFIMVNSTISNTLAFLDNPHLFLKTVPFILFESAGWNPAYYASMMVPWEFTDTDNWAETKLIHYFQYFQNAQGRRVRMHCPDPDFQYAAFVEGDELYVYVHNMADKTEVLDLNLPSQYNIEEITLTQLIRQSDFRPLMTEEVINDLTGINIEGRGSIALKIKLAEEVQEERYLNEIPFYSDEVATEFQGQATFNVPMDDIGTIEYAYMRIGINRPSNANKNIEVKLNGNDLIVPLEDAADRFTSDDGYASTKIIPLDINLLSNQNEVIVTLPDNQSGGIGSVVIRAAIQDYFVDVEVPINSGDFSLFPNPSKDGFTIKLDERQISEIEEITIYNNVGQLVDKFQVDENAITISWNIHNRKTISSGVYHVILKNKNGAIASKKWIKE
ncbi:MAG: T9SS type A sorting domain-containing protein [Bacteroidota bacterium]